MSRITVIGLDGRPLSAEAESLLRGAALVVGGDGTWRRSASRRAVRRPGGDLSGRSRAWSGPVGRSWCWLPGIPDSSASCVCSGSGSGARACVLPAVFCRARLRAGRYLLGRRRHGKRPRPRPARALNVCRAHPKVAVLTSPRYGPAELARELEGWERTYFVAEKLGEQDERTFHGDAAAVLGEKWDYPNVVLVLDERRVIGTKGWVSAGSEGPGLWALPEDGFEHRSGMITKSETRALVLSRLGPGPGDLIWDVGAGSGSVAIECARLGAAALAVEREPESCTRVRDNAARHGVCVRVVEGEAPDALRDLPDPDAVFVGGSGGGFEEIVKLCAVRARRVVVIALVTLERVVPAGEVLKDCGLEVETAFMQTARVKGIGELHRLDAMTPVFVVSGRRP